MEKTQPAFSCDGTQRPVRGDGAAGHGLTDSPQSPDHGHEWQRCEWCSVPNLPRVPKWLGHDGQKEDNMTNNILKLAQQARTNAQLLTVSQGGIRSLTREDALKTRGDVVEAIRRLQVFEKDLAKKLDT